MSNLNVLDLAQALHEAGRAAVESGQSIAHTQGQPSRKFIEWNELAPEARQGRIKQAAWLLEHFEIARKV